MTDLEKEITETEATEKETLDELAELDADLDEVEDLLDDEDWDDDDAEEIPLCRTADTKKKLLLFAGIVLGIAAIATATAIALSKKKK